MAEAYELTDFVLRYLQIPLRTLSGLSQQGKPSDMAAKFLLPQKQAQDFAHVGVWFDQFVDLRDPSYIAAVLDNDRQKLIDVIQQHASQYEIVFAKTANLKNIATAHSVLGFGITRDPHRAGIVHARWVLEADEPYSVSAGVKKSGATINQGLIATPRNTYLRMPEMERNAVGGWSLIDAPKALAAIHALADMGAVKIPVLVPTDQAQEFAGDHGYKRKSYPSRPASILIATYAESMQAQQAFTLSNS